MIISDEILQKLEKLSMLKIENKEAARRHLEEVLAFMNGLKILEEDITKPQPSQIAPLREDVIIPSHLSDEVLKNAPCSDGRFFIVPKIIE